MKCPKCKSTQDHVVDTRPRVDHTVKRRRECYICGHRWNTTEREDIKNGVCIPKHEDEENVKGIS